MSSIAMVSGVAALLAGITKYGLDLYRAKHHPAGVILAVGSASIQIPSSYTPDQVAALVTVLQKNAGGT